MARPKFTPGSTVVFAVRNRAGKKPLASYLATRLGVVDAWAADLVDNGHVLLDGALAAPGQLINLSAGPHEITVHFPDAWPRHMAAVPMDLDILYEDDCLLALNKPPGIVVHPARGHLDNNTLQNGVRWRFRHRIGQDGVTIGPPHRLDKDTSGVNVFALTTAAYISLVDQFSAAQPHKTYLCLLDTATGGPPPHAFACDSAIAPDPDRKGLGKAVAPGSGGKEALTEFAVLETGPGWAWAQARPHTGRAHQIRIHAASMGWPLAGDADYNPCPDRLGLARQALHAAELTFAHPVSGAPVRVCAPLAADIAAALERLRQ